MLAKAGFTKIYNIIDGFEGDTVNDPESVYHGKRMKNGQIPVQAWGTVKKPYKQLMTAFMDSNFHAIICGREGVIMEDELASRQRFHNTYEETKYRAEVLVRGRMGVFERQGRMQLYVTAIKPVGAGAARGTSAVRATGAGYRRSTAAGAGVDREDCIPLIIRTAEHIPEFEVRKRS